MSLLGVMNVYVKCYGCVWQVLWMCLIGVMIVFDRCYGCV